MSGGLCLSQESAGVVCSRLSWKGTAEPPPLLSSLPGFWDPWEQGKVNSQAGAGTVALWLQAGWDPSPLSLCQERRPPWHPAPSCSHRPLQMFLIILTATSRPRRASQTGDSLFLWDSSPPGQGREGEGGSSPAHHNCSSSSGANVSHRWDLAVAQLPKAKSRAGSQRTGQKGVLLLNSCCSWGCSAVGGHGGRVGGGFTADPYSCGCHTGWGSHRCSPQGAVVGTGWPRWLSWPRSDAGMQEGSVEAVSEPCGVSHMSPKSPPGNAAGIPRYPGEREQDPKGKALPHTPCPW